MSHYYHRLHLMSYKCIFLKAKTPQDSEEGLLFMQEMVELTKMQIQPETKPQTVTFIKPNTDPPEKVTLLAGPAQFGPELQNFDKITGKVIFTYPPAACTDLLNADRLAGKIVIMDRGSCMFIEKVCAAKHFEIALSHCNFTF